MFWLIVTIILLLQNFGVLGLEVETDDEDSTSTTTANPEKAKDLYIIRKVVYEIRILTEADNLTLPENKTHEEIDVSFFDPQDNGTFVDLSNIPLPVEANLSGVSVTGLVKTDLGAILFPANGTAGQLSDSVLTPLFPGKQIKVTRNITTIDRNGSQDILSDISDVLGLTKKIRKSPHEKSSEISEEESQNSSEENDKNVT